jgi:F0F1-type ATP synthase delta subunit
MADQLDSIIAHSFESVNKKKEHIENNFEKTDWTKIEQLETSPFLNHITDNSRYTQVNNAYTDLEQAVKLNKLTDPFRVQKDQETRSATERSLAQTIERYARQHSILQAYST